MAVARTPRDAWIARGLEALAAGGPDAVRVEVLAQALGVSKGGFYGYFRNRDALLEEMLDTWEREAVETVIEEVDGAGGDARTRLDRLFTITAAADGPARGVAVELAIRDWARREESVAQRLRRVDNRRMEYLRSLFGSFCPDKEEVELRCMLTFSLRLGSHLIAAEHAGLSRAQVMELARKRLLA